MVEQAAIDNCGELANSIRAATGYSVLKRRASACVRFIVGPLLVALLILACYSAWSIGRFGNLTNGIEFLNGSVLIAEKPMLELGKVPVGTEVEGVFVLKNVTNQPIAIVGGKAECSCVITTGFPMQVDPMCSARLSLRFTPRPSDANRRVVHRAVLYLDVDSPAMILTFAADVVPVRTMVPNGSSISDSARSRRFGSLPLKGDRPCACLVYLNHYASAQP
jgi:hypothetical protein